MMPPNSALRPTAAKRRLPVPSSLRRDENGDGGNMASEGDRTEPNPSLQPTRLRQAAELER